MLIGEEVGHKMVSEIKAGGYPLTREPEVVVHYSSDIGAGGIGNYTRLYKAEGNGGLCGYRKVGYTAVIRVYPEGDIDGYLMEPDSLTQSYREFFYILGYSAVMKSGAEYRVDSGRGGFYLSERFVVGNKILYNTSGGAISLKIMLSLLAPLS